jgi:hypothetical protein
VAYMLRVPALELRDPVMLLVLVVPNDLTVHGLALLYKSRPDTASGLNEGSFTVSSDQSHVLGDKVVAADHQVVA